MQQFVIERLKDEKLEVQTVASDTLSGMLKGDESVYSCRLGTIRSTKSPLARLVVQDEVRSIFISDYPVSTGF